MKLSILLFIFVLSACATKVPLQKRTLPDGKAKFCFIGDMGLGNNVQAMVAEALEKESCHSIHFLGDLIYPSGISSVTDPVLEDRFLKFYRPLTKTGHHPPMNLILGNHDYRGNAQSWLDLAQQHSKINFPHYYYIQNWNGLCLVHLDSNFYKLFYYTFKAMGQSSWLSSNMEYLNEQCRVKVALAHHPHKNPGPRHGDSSGYMRFFYKRHIMGKFDYLITGHEHILADQGTEDGTHMLISGAGGHFTKGHDVGYLVMEVDIDNGVIQNHRHYFRRFTIPLTK
jgi:tartrate-resistant acid phosphatase type 5